MTSTSAGHVNLAFIGTGNWARHSHLPALAHLRQHTGSRVTLNLRGIYGIEQEQARQLAAEHGFERCYAALDELLADEAVNAVAVVVSIGAVYEVVKRLLPRRVPILCEKPPGADLQQARELARTVTVPNVVAFNRRYKPMNEHFGRMLGLGPRVREVAGFMYRRNRSEDHFVRYTGIHLVNLMEYYFGPIVATWPITDPPPAFEREQIAGVRFAGGLSGRLVFSPCSDQMWEGVEVTTDSEVLRLRGPLNDDPGEILVDGLDGQHRRVAPGAALPRVAAEGFVDEYLELFQTIPTPDHPTRSTFATSVNSLEVAAAIGEGRTWEAT